MKEKTFEELIHPKFDKRWGEPVRVDFTKKEIIQFLQQVREATIAEVLKLADDNLFNKEPKVKLIGEIESLPTDRIKLTQE